LVHSVVHRSLLHTSPIKEMVTMKKQPEVIVRCVGARKEPSKEALDRFIEIYVRMVKENQKKLRR
jgi:hypothetical protein